QLFASPRCWFWQPSFFHGRRTHKLRPEASRTSFKARRAIEEMAASLVAPKRMHPPCLHLLAGSPAPVAKITPVDGRPTPRTKLTVIRLIPMTSQACGDSTAPASWALPLL